MKKVTWSIWNYAEQNTPKIANKIGNYLLILSGIGISIIGIPKAMALLGIDGFIIPEQINLYAKYAVAGGVFVKMFVKTLGTNTTNPTDDKQ